MQDSAFQPILGGQTILVGTTAVQLASVANAPALQDYRIRCLVAGYLTWGVPTASAPAAAGAPSAATPSVNTVGYAVGNIEILKLPVNAWFISSVSAGFEITLGEGL